MKNLTLYVAASVIVVSFLAFGDDDPVRAALDKAKVEYEKDLAAYQELANDFFTKKEDEAREKGNLKQVNQIKTARETFENTGELPSSAPTTLRLRPTTALATLSVAYTKAIENYTRNKQDELATATKRELAELKFKAGFPSIEGNWHEGEGIRIQITQAGNKFKATCKYQNQNKEIGEINWVMTGTISRDGEFKGELVHTKAPRGFLNQTRTGTFSPSLGTITGTATFKGGEHDFVWKVAE